MLWCNTMLLLRTINANMLEDSTDSLLKGSTIDEQTYLKKLLNFMQAQGLSERIYGFLCYLMNQPDADITQALLEEIELIMSVVA